MNPPEQNKILLQSSASEAMPVNTAVTITASSPGEDEFAFKVISGNSYDRGRDATHFSLTSPVAGQCVVEAADSKGNTARITVEFFDVPG